jgi:phosphoribosyl 1,2-cyclic phosphodiesterase
MFHLTVLGSGSSGNCSLLETESARLLVDAGLSARQITTRLSALGVAPERIDGILLTHEHSDHSRALEVWSKRFGTPIYANRLTAEALSKTLPGARWRHFVTGTTFDLQGFEIRTFPVSHDAAEPVGFVFEYGGVEAGFLTDLGIATRLVVERVKSVHTLVIETNHDEKLLQEDTRRPWSVKQRIFSRHGHLSNAAAAEVLAGLVPGNLRCAVLGHLSGDCNRPELAIETVQSRLRAAGAERVEVLCALQNEPTPRLRVGQDPTPE